MSAVLVEGSAVLDGLDQPQRRAACSTEGPVLIIAGPGAGKTLTLVRRTLHILASGLAEPGQVVLCTFAEKAALELRDRLRGAAASAGYTGDLSALRIGTIHGVCNDFVDRYRHLTPLGNGYEVLDDLTQKLFLFEHFDGIVGTADDSGKYLGRWATKWTAIAGLCRYLDKITEELVDAGSLEVSGEAFLASLARAHRAYEATLVEENRVDFAHIQRFFLDLLDDPQAGPAVIGGVSYVMVDEYQDTNYIQQRLLDRLSSATGNLCVVGDEDQSLYRFRGATVRNIVEFPLTHEGTAVLKLTTNYRSHQAIVGAYDHFMASADWTNPNGPPFRFDKTITPDPRARSPEYPAVFSIWGTSRRDEATRFAEMVGFLCRNGVVEDYSQVALLLHSVRTEHSGPYLEALERAGIPAFCPRARAYFDDEEVQAALACLAVVLGWHGEGRGKVSGHALPQLAAMIDTAIAALGRRFADPQPLARSLQRWRGEIDGLGESDSLDRRPADYLYELLAVEPFAGWLGDENRARNLATLSELLSVFQRYYHYTVVTQANLRSMRLALFNSFLRLLHSGGINEYEDPDQPFPKGHVQVMTIHQAKGLEFPVVVVGSLATQLSSPKDVDRTLGPYFHRPTFEPESRITAFDRMRLHYVGFSRPEKLLVLTSTETPKAHFEPIWQGLAQWPYVRQDLLAAQGFAHRERLAPKASFSFTGDLRVYETCHRQYQMFRHYDFTPSRSAVIFFGLLVHQTIEDIHRLVLAGKLNQIDDARVEGLFEFNFRHLARRDVRPIGANAKASALRQVLHYLHQNRHEMHRVQEAEVDVSMEKEGYILTGAVDLLLADDGSLEVLDFKAQARPPDTEHAVRTYYQQLCIYAHILEHRRGRRPDRLLLYWTGEPTRQRALMSFEYRPEDVAGAVTHFDEVVAAVQAQRFDVPCPPPPAICKECDFRSYCAATGTIDPQGGRLMPYEITRTELVWPGKYDEDGRRREPERVALPFQVIERVNESRASREVTKEGRKTLFDYYEPDKAETFEDGWRNKLIWGDNLLVMNSLLDQFAGKIDLIYIDPPFATGADFSFSAPIGETEQVSVFKEQSLIEEFAYRDTWGQGRTSYLTMLYERLWAIRQLLSPAGTLYVHLDHRQGSHVRLILDEFFGETGFRNSLAWCYTGPSRVNRDFPDKHDTIWRYVRGPDFYFDISAPEVRVPYAKSLKAATKATGIYAARDEDLEYTQYDERGKLAEDWWSDISPVGRILTEDMKYPTQKPEKLLARIVAASSPVHGLVADFFVGSGTTAAVAEKLGRRWIACDLGRYAIHTTRKRLLDIPDCKPFEVLNLGRYERQYWQGATFAKDRRGDKASAIYEYLAFILRLYHATPVSGMAHLHGRKDRAFVHIGAVDAPVTIGEINDCLTECAALKAAELHVLGWEWEMGMSGLIQDAARSQGIKLLLRQIPREVMEAQAAAKGDVEFFELAYLEVEVEAGTLPRQFSGALRNFVIPNPELVPDDVRAKITKWSDYVDYWAVDWDFRDDTFHQGWVTYRTRKDRSLALESDPHTYEQPGEYTVMVKVIDIFGNDTSKICSLTVP